MHKKTVQFYSSLYIYASILLGPLSLMLGLGSTSGGGDDSDESYIIEDGVIDIPKRNAEYMRARYIVYILAGAGIVAGLISGTSMIMAYKKGAISRHSLIVNLLLSGFMISGYMLAVYFATVWFTII